MNKNNKTESAKESLKILNASEVAIMPTVEIGIEYTSNYKCRDVYFNLLNRKIPTEPVWYCTRCELNGPENDHLSKDTRDLIKLFFEIDEVVGISLSANRVKIEKRECRDWDYDDWDVIIAGVVSRITLLLGCKAKVSIVRSGSSEVSV